MVTHLDHSSIVWTDSKERKFLFFCGHRGLVPKSLTGEKKIVFFISTISGGKLALNLKRSRILGVTLSLYYSFRQCLLLFSFFQFVFC